MSQSNNCPHCLGIGYCMFGDAGRHKQIEIQRYENGEPVYRVYCDEGICGDIENIRGGSTPEFLCKVCDGTEQVPA